MKKIGLESGITVLGYRLMTNHVGWKRSMSANRWSRKVGIR